MFEAVVWSAVVMEKHPCVLQSPIRVTQVNPNHTDSGIPNRFKRPPQRSPVWYYVIVVEQNEFARCNLCQRVVVASKVVRALFNYAKSYAFWTLYTSNIGRISIPRAKNFVRRANFAIRNRL